MLYSPRHLKNLSRLTLKSVPNHSYRGLPLSLTDSDPRLAPLIQWTTIPGGIWGTKITLETMANLAKEAANQKRVRHYALACGDWNGVDLWIRNHFVYREEEEEILRTPEFMLNDLEMQGYLEGDCDDTATLSAAFTKILGYPTRLTALQVQTPLEFDHVFSECRDVNGEWAIIDPTVPKGTRYESYGVLLEVV